MADLGEYRPVIKKLIRKTREGQVFWQESRARPNHFEAGVGPAYVGVHRSEDEYGATTIRVYLRDLRENLLHGVDVNDTDEDFNELEWLHDWALRSARNVPGLLDEMLRSLGGPESEEDEDERPGGPPASARPTGPDDAAESSGPPKPRTGG